MSYWLQVAVAAPAHSSIAGPLTYQSESPPAVGALVRAPLEALTRQPLAAISSLEQQEDGVLLRCQADELPWMALSFAALPFAFRILEPDALAQEIAAHARQLLALAGQVEHSA